MSYNTEFEIEPTFEYSMGVVNEGDEVYVCGVEDKLLGIGRFTGTLILLGADGTPTPHPIIEVQGELIAGGDVDLWSPDRELIERHRQLPTYPIADYLVEITNRNKRWKSMVDTALAAQMGVILK